MKRGISRGNTANYPVRTCMSIHECCVCGNSITLGQRYRDGGHGRRSHVSNCHSQKPSVAATDRASAVKPVESRATVGATDLPSVIYLRLGHDRRFGQDYVRIWDSSLAPNEGLVRFERAESDRCARLEKLLLEIVRRWDAWEVGECSLETAELKLSNLDDAIEAARRELPNA